MNTNKKANQNKVTIARDKRKHLSKKKEEMENGTLKEKKLPRAQSAVERNSSNMRKDEAAIVHFSGQHNVSYKVKVKE